MKSLWARIFSSYGREEREMYKMIFEANLKINKAIGERRLAILREKEEQSK